MALCLCSYGQIAVAINQTLRSRSPVDMTQEEKVRLENFVAYNDPPGSDPWEAGFTCKASQSILASVKR